jgi:dTDP-4-amino-4,6-dideoxy-D-galactose acyltransferase
MKFQRDDWISSVLGYAVYRVSIDGQTPPDPEHLAATSTPLLNGTERAFYFAKVPTTASRWLAALTGLGFMVMDVNVTFAYPVEQPLQVDLNPAITVQPVKPEHHNALLDIAKSCFVYSRFHLDPHISRQADGLKREWINNYVKKQRGMGLYVALVDGVPAGFLAVIDAQHGTERRIIVDLIGVDKAVQGQGVGTALMAYFVQTFQSECDSLRVGTQVSNVPSIRLYERMGFRFVESTYVMHAHTQDGKVITYDV